MRRKNGGSWGFSKHPLQRPLGASFLKQDFTLGFTTALKEALSNAKALVLARGLDAL